MSARSPILLVALVALAAIVGGCGDDSDSDSATSANETGADSGAGSRSDSGSDSSGPEGAQDEGAEVTTSSLSREEFVKRASAACQKEREKILAETAAFVKRLGTEEIPVTRVVRSVQLPKIEAEIEIIRSLGAPEGDEEEIEEILAAQEVAVEEVRGVEQIKTFNEVEKYFADATEMFRDYGFTACTN